MFNGPEITAYSFLPPTVGSLLGQLGGLKGLMIDFWILAIVLVLYMNKILDPAGAGNINKGKAAYPNGTIIVYKKTE